MVQLDLDGGAVCGEFAGVDSCGRLQLEGPEGERQIFEPHEVRFLRELPNDT
jgi:hypothetical protein